MDIVSISEIRQNASKIVARMLKENEPVVIMQRSKPVAYLIEAGDFEDMQKKIAELERIKNEQSNKKSIQLFDSIREKTAGYEAKKSSVEIIREIREDRL